jgi:hypothetical protein
MPHNPPTSMKDKLPAWDFQFWKLDQRLIRAHKWQVESLERRLRPKGPKPWRGKPRRVKTSWKSST